MSTHTPGPWTIEEDASECVVSRDPEANEFHIVARAYGPDDNANARLIAAAPDLLFSLKALTLFLKDRTETSHLLNVAMEQARAAIAKAESVS